MVKSLYSGVAGLQAHQVAMDIESNNIANVNTVGYKYSRANFSDMLAQTKSIATSPQGDLGGKNAVQVGLGSSVNSATRIFSQGSVQASDKKTDIAIEGDGFFVVSPDHGNTYKYTRAGDFKFDAAGNFVDNNGFITQGWLKDDVTGKVDTTTSIADIQITPGLTTPANPTTEVLLKANLNSGPLVTSFSPAYEVPSGAPNPINNGLDAIDAAGNPIKSGDIGVMFNESGEAFSLQQNQGVWIGFVNTSKTDGGAVSAGAAELDITFTLDNGTTKQITTTGGDAANTVSTNANRFVSAINAQSATTGITANYDSVNNKINLSNTNATASASHNIRVAATAGGSGIVAGTVTTAYKYQYDPVSSINTVGTDKKFSSLADLRYAMELQARDPDGDGIQNNIEIKVNSQGKLELSNPGGSAQDYDIDLHISGLIEAGVTDNVRFTTNMFAMNTVLPVGSTGIAYSQGFEAATHSSGIDIFDSLGSKHTLQMSFRKTAVDSITGSTWDMKITVPQPATIDTISPTNEKTGSIRFNSDGSLITFSPPNVSFSANNGSKPAQQVSFNFGTSNGLDGLSSFDSTSVTGNISQDGYTGGDLQDISIDASGTIIGSFSNGKDFALAQLSMAKFTNNEGLMTDGGNTFSQSANSGEPLIGTAATAGRGSITSSALESSNVDLSRALTQLIIIQRGYQANGKTITTADQLLQTLIGLKT
jgi:flagellar hook protein FlgE